MAPDTARVRVLIFIAAIVGFSIGSAILPHPDARPADRWAALITAGMFAVFLALLLFVHERRAARRSPHD